MKTLLSVIAAAFLLLSPQPTNERLRIGENLRNENVLLPSSTPDKSNLILTDYVKLLNEDGAVAILACYDDPQTRLKIDYVELYDLSGNLILVNWIDGFGVSHLALDRGLLREYPVLDRVLVQMPGGTEF